MGIDKPITEPPASPGTPAGPRFEIRERFTELVFGERKLRVFIPAIQQLRRECGQEDDLTTNPEYFIAANTLSDRRVEAVLIRKDRALEACVLFFEHRKFGIGHGILHGGDAVGEGLFAGPEIFRWQYVQLATRAMLGALAGTRRHPYVKGFPQLLCNRAAPDRQMQYLLRETHPTQASTGQHLSGDVSQHGPALAKKPVGKTAKVEASAQVTFLPSLAPAQAFEAMLALERKSLPRAAPSFITHATNCWSKAPSSFVWVCNSPTAHG